MATILWNILATFLIIYLMCSIIDGLVTTIDITVEGRGVIQSGVRHYSVHRSDESNRRELSIKCVLQTAVRPNKVRLLNDQSTTVEFTMNERTSRFTSEWSKNISVNSSVAIIPDRYTCEALFVINSRSVVNGSQSYSVIYSGVDIVYVTQEDGFTGLSVGLNAYTGEQVSIACKGYKIKTYASNCGRKYEKKPELINIPPANFSGQNKSFGYDCGYTYDQCGDVDQSRCKCDLQIDVAIWPTLELTLIPSNFSSNVTTLQFICTSFPPRLLRWTIITDSGDILDFLSSDDIIKVSMNVSITQRPGETVLNVSEAFAGGNGILSVICSSYDTPAKVSASSHRVLIDECNGGDSVTAPSTVKIPSTVTLPPTVTVPSTTSTTKSTVMSQQGTITNYDSFHTTEKTSVPQNCERQKPTFAVCAESMHFQVFLVLVTTLTCTLAAVVLILLRKLRQTVVRASTTTCDDNDKVPSETILHDNPLYLSYSETAASSPDDAVQNDVSFYSNI